ncbi:D-isomer specific 2-hydroxyacid dehydrogenase family protein [Clostridium sp. chh4-2]|uniref:D-isomer specific 2-hydroxyacid dehydrogenase family protein n=1 Tax=Clostridium sp. chh4-2 TaxID=2067550 RepID=UPI0015E1ADD8|nr:D-isomer specific 2-hydroxyacid dehydrogenase family protein [Clostridium sp. chh4-2]
MRVAVFNCREDEKEFFTQYAPQYGAEVVDIPQCPTAENTGLTYGCDCVNITSDAPVTAEMIDRYVAGGVKYLVTRTIGREHIDTEYAAKAGLGVGSITYSPDSVADYTIMLILMVLRNVKTIMKRSEGGDFSLTAVRGRQLGNLTVGLLGTGNIGAVTAKHLSGFGCRIFAHTRHPSPELKGILTYVDFDTLLAQSDILSLHVPADSSTFHIVDREAIGKMKAGAVLINTARGTLVDTDALIDGLESGRIGGAGLDVVENDREIFYRDQKQKIIPNRQMAVLNAMPNVILLPHTAFYTDQAVKDMVKRSLQNCCEYLDTCKEKEKTA